MKKYFDNLPSFVWVILIPLGLILFIGGIMTLFWALATVEGVASVVMLIAAFFTIRAGAFIPSDSSVKTSSFLTAVGLCFFALMGIAIDQTGNVIYNKPIEIFFCPPNTTLLRGVDVLHPTPGRTDIIQEYNCVDHDKEFVKGIDLGSVILVRFIEYIILGYLLIGINKLINTSRHKTPSPNTLPVPDERISI